MVSLQKCLDILEHVARGSHDVESLAKGLDLSRKSTRRALEALMARDHILGCADGSLRVGPKVRYLAVCASRSTEFLPLARKAAGRLSSVVGHSAFVGRRDGHALVHLHRSQACERLSVVTGPGERQSLTGSALGKALLLDENVGEWRRVFSEHEPAIQSQDLLADMKLAACNGFVMDEGAFPDHINSIAAPVREASGKIIASIGIAGPRRRLPAHRMSLLGIAVADAAWEVSAALGCEKQLRED